MRQYKTREQYLVAMAKEINDVLFIPAGYPVNLDKVKVSCGFTTQGGKKNAAIGQCFNDKTNGFNEIFIHPVLADESRVGDVLAHEMIHAYDNCKHGHRGPFRRIAKAIGLTGKMTATIASDEMKVKLAKIQKKLGKYPHEALDYKPRKKQGTRNLKIECPKCADTSPYFVRMSKTMFEKGAPKCGQCGTKMTDDITAVLIDEIQKTQKIVKVTEEERDLLSRLAYSEFSDEDIERGEIGGGGYIDKHEFKIAQALKNKGVIHIEKLDYNEHSTWGWIKSYFLNTGENKIEHVGRIINIHTI